MSSTTSTRRPASSTGATGGVARAPSATAASASGTRIVSVNVLPSPGTPLLSATSEPSISSDRRRLIARPRPVPPNRRAIVASAWLNDWNRRPIRSAGMPIPVSETASRISHRRDAPGASPSASSGDPVTRTTTSPVSVNLIEFDSRFSVIWRSRPASPTTQAGSSGSIA